MGRTRDGWIIFIYRWINCIPEKIKRVANIIIELGPGGWIRIKYYSG
jgi:hypothetical protein